MARDFPFQLNRQNFSSAFLGGSTNGVIVLTGVTWTETATGNQRSLTTGAGVDKRVRSRAFRAPPAHVRRARGIEAVRHRR